MDSTAEEITFDAQGVCSFCRHFEEKVRPYWHPGTQESLAQLENLVAKIKCSQRSSEYDAIIGLSGGVDSSYLACWAVKSAGLRLLAVHVDGGWNSELAVQNIEQIVKKLNIDLHTYVVNWQAMKEVQLAFFKAGVANQDTPQDHAFSSALYRFAVDSKIKYILSGSNIATESCLPVSWGHNAGDVDQILDICRTYKAQCVNKFPLESFFGRCIYFPYIRKMEVVTPLNYLDYSKEEAIQTLEKELGWKYYGGKHYESRFTRFFQSYWLPKKFGFDKRKAHFSSLILSGQMTRDLALEELQKPSFDQSSIESDIEYVAKKLGISKQEFLKLMEEPNRIYKDFRNNDWKRRYLLKPFNCASTALREPQRVFGWLGIKKTSCGAKK
jgi:N-acetyl sugar amidotransferase